MIDEPYPGSVPSLVPKNVDRFTGVQFDKQRQLSDGQVVRVITYQAYNAMGLIGSEYNGVAVLLEEPPRVLTDGLKRSASGYNGVSAAAWRLANHLISCPEHELYHTVVDSENYRGDWECPNLMLL
jgi:hypothetical protein